MSRVSLRVEYVRQLFDPDSWSLHGFRSREESLEWSDNACGIACLLMALRYFGRDRGIELHDLLHQGIATGAYSPRGWIHAKLAEMADSYGLASSAREVGDDLEEICRLIHRRVLVIASVTWGFPCDGRKGGHLVLLNGFSRGGETITRLNLRDPSSWGLRHRSVDPQRFLCSFTGRIVSIGPER